MPLLFTINRADNDFFASADAGLDFFVARRVPYENNIGLANIVKHSKLEKLFYKAGDYTGQHGFWAEFIEPTAICEGRSFLTLNTYDRARFMFGFAQFAAHVPDGDFVKFFRAMLGLAQATHNQSTSMPTRLSDRRSTRGSIPTAGCGSIAGLPRRWWRCMARRPAPRLVRSPRSHRATAPA